MSKDPDAEKGAVAQDRPDQETNTSLEGQNPHRGKGDMLEGQDSDLPEPGENEEHSMEGHMQHSRFGGDASDTSQKKRNQNDQQKDPKSR